MLCMHIISWVISHVNSELFNNGDSVKFQSFIFKSYISLKYIGLLSDFNDVINILNIFDEELFEEIAFRYLTPEKNH